ncbi:MAG: TetR/AcrR family transcriptional regulator [Thermoleophilaceae bacterium]
MAEGVVAERALRADAQRNLEAILEAAAEAFAEKGHEACVADIAKRAGVGQATIFRRFETKDDLIAAVFERKVAQMLDAVRAASRKRSAWEGLREFMGVVTELQLRDRGFFQANAQRLIDLPHIKALKQEVHEEVSALVARAKEEGGLREDLSAEDIFALSLAAAQAATMGPSPSPRVWRRYLQVVMDGMRAA